MIVEHIKEKHFCYRAITGFFVDATKSSFLTNDIFNYYFFEETKFQLHYERKPLIPIESLAKTKYKTFKQEVRAFNLFSNCRRLKSLKNSPLEYFAAFFTCLSSNISLQTNKISKMA